VQNLENKDEIGVTKQDGWQGLIIWKAMLHWYFNEGATPLPDTRIVG